MWSFASNAVFSGLICQAAARVGVVPMAPIRGIAYGALPCTKASCSDITGAVSEDMVQQRYAPEWGIEGRDDLGVMASLGANTVRLYHSLGLDMNQDHRGFLDHAHEVGLNVMPGFHSYSSCPEFDCFETWKSATLKGFSRGYREGNQWHSAISAVILLNEPDFFGDRRERVKLMLSALDGVLAAEREAGVAPGRVRLTVTWSFGMRESIDGKVIGPGTFGFEDVVAGIANPALAGYTPRSGYLALQNVLSTRWINGVNVQAPWDFVKAVIYNDYAKNFGPVPWFIGEYGANGQTTSIIKKDLVDMQQLAQNDPTFLGAAFFQFQTAYFKTGSELNFGMFSLGDEIIGEIAAPLDATCPTCSKTWPVHCLRTKLPFLPDVIAHRAEAVAAAWNGTLVRTKAFCKDGQRRLAAGDDNIWV